MKIVNLLPDIGNVKYGTEESLLFQK